MYPTDFEADTSHLTLEEDGAYNRLLRLMWMTHGCSLPDNQAWIARRMRVSMQEFESIVLPVIDEFFTRSGGRILSKRLREEFEKADETYKRRSEAGKKGGRPKASENKQENLKAGLSNEKAGPKQPEPEPEPYNSVSEDTGQGASQDLAKLIFGQGLHLLSSAGVGASQARSILGKWRKDYTDAEIIAAIGVTQREGAIDPVAFIAKVLSESKKRSDANQQPKDGELKKVANGWRQYDPSIGWFNLHPGQVKDMGLE
jgi:uncharacterized protein YdaU (DUF1376 family)